MKKRNKRIDIMAFVDLAPLTERILGQMGQEGDHIRKRLKVFYRQRICKGQNRFEDQLENAP
ncbi:MAG: hypothetical protein P8168_10160 [Deltaproteobacteria bacterium]|jgi:hypothetical protein